MVLDAISNFVRGETDAAVDNSQTTVSVVDASIFPDPETAGEFNVVVWNANNFPRPDQDSDVEILRVTATDTTADELTVVRAQEGTAAAAHPSGSAIHLSPTAKMFGDIESTFADFWDAGSEELTADVNNESVSTDQLNTEPTGTLVTLDGNQSVADNTVTKIEWETEDARGNVSNLLNASNEVVIPAGFDWAKITMGIFWDTKTEMDLLDTRMNGAAPPLGADSDIRIDSGKTFKGQTAFFSVSEGDTLTMRTRHQSGSSLDIIDFRNTFMEVLLL